MNAAGALRAALRQASPDWRPVLLAELLAEELRRAALNGGIDGRVADAVNAHLSAAADAMMPPPAHALAVGDDVLANTAAGAQRGFVAALFATTVVLDSGIQVARDAVVRNFTIRPEVA